MLQENEFIQQRHADDFSEELSLEFDSGMDPEAVWEWNGESWAPVAA